MPRTAKQVLAEQKKRADAARAARTNTAMVKKAANVPAADSNNPWIEVSTELDKFLGAPLLKFSKQGEFTIGDTDSLPEGTRCIAHTDEITLGWQKWQDGKPVERRIGRVADSFVPPRRDELGDTDKQLWEIDDDGEPRDPWQFQMAVPVTRLDAGGETYCFTTSSKGGLACMNSLTRTYGRRVQNEKVPGLPIVELKADSYKHRRYGKIFTPQMIVVEWTGADGKPLSLADDLNDEIAI